MEMETLVPLPRLLAALQSGKTSVRLDDGTFGILPIDWLQKYTVLTELGEVADDGSGILLRQRQAALVASLLDDRVTESDMHFRKLVDEWQGKLAAPADSSEVSLDGVEAELRPYQKDGVAWMAKMHHLELGGCLADDMGLGKTLQVLAVIQSCRQQAIQQGTPFLALVVSPASVIDIINTLKPHCAAYSTILAYCYIIVNRIVLLIRHIFRKPFLSLNLIPIKMFLYLQFNLVFS